MSLRILVKGVIVYLEYKNSNNKQRKYFVNDKEIETTFDTYKKVEKIYLKNDIFKGNEELHILVED